MRFYENSVKNLKSYAKLSNARMDAITSEHISAFVAERQTADVEVSTINRELATLRRMFHLAQEWARLRKSFPASSS